MAAAGATDPAAIAARHPLADPHVPPAGVGVAREPAVVVTKQHGVSIPRRTRDSSTTPSLDARIGVPCPGFGSNRFRHGNADRGARRGERIRGWAKRQTVLGRGKNGNRHGPLRGNGRQTTGQKSRAAGRRPIQL